MNAVETLFPGDGVSGHLVASVFVLSVCGVLLSGCGGDGGTEHASGGAAGSGNGGSAAGSGGDSGGAGGSVSAGHAGQPAGAGAGVGGSAGAAGAATVDCSGSFGAPATLLTLPDGEELASVSVTPDELQVFYALTKADGSVSFQRSSRAAKDANFPAGTSVTELDALCAAPTDLRGLDLSTDGLRAYAVCITKDVLPFVGQLRMLERADLGAAFVADAKNYGSVGSSPAISRDELTLYTSSDYNPGADPSRRYSRASRDAKFGVAEDIPGLETQITTAPDPAPDGLGLFMGSASALAMSTRATASDSFGVPTTLVPRTDMAAFGSPDISQDCRSLYFVGIAYVEQKSVYSLQVLRR